MIRYSWQSELKQIASVYDLVALARHYLDEWQPEEIAILPPDTWPDHPRSVDDLVGIALKLERIQSGYGEQHGPRTLQELLTFFSQVSIRALQLQLAGAARDKPVADEEG